MIYTVTLNPALDKTVEIPGMALDTVNRITEMRTDPGGKGINVSKVIAKLGGESCAAGILGGGSGKMLETLEELTAEGRKLLERGIERVVISLGGRGALYLRKGSTIYAEGLRVPVGSTVGAGDSVVAALAYAEAQGLSEEEAVRLSTAAGAANVMCSGTQAAEREAVEALLPKVRFTRLRP